MIKTYACVTKQQTEILAHLKIFVTSLPMEKTIILGMTCDHCVVVYTYTHTIHTHTCMCVYRDHQWSVFLAAVGGNVVVSTY